MSDAQCRQTQTALVCVFCRCHIWQLLSVLCAKISTGSLILYLTIKWWSSHHRRGTVSVRSLTFHRYFSVHSSIQFICFASRHWHQALRGFSILILHQISDGLNTDWNWMVLKKNSGINFVWCADVTSSTSLLIQNRIMILQFILSGMKTIKLTHLPLSSLLCLLSYTLTYSMYKRDIECSAYSIRFAGSMQPTTLRINLSRLKKNSCNADANERKLWQWCRATTLKSS